VCVCMCVCVCAYVRVCVPRAHLALGADDVGLALLLCARDDEALPLGLRAQKLANQLSGGGARGGKRSGRAGAAQRSCVCEATAQCRCVCEATAQREKREDTSRLGNRMEPEGEQLGKCKCAKQRARSLGGRGGGGGACLLLRHLLLFDRARELLRFWVRAQLARPSPRTNWIHPPTPLPVLTGQVSSLPSY